jgi:succinoglycan biosynthesis protein ExoM
MDIAVCIATYNRPEGLYTLLNSLVQQRGLSCSWGIIVVDNDPEESARKVVSDFRDEFSNIEYVIEPDPGIPAARNRGIAVARRYNARMVAFIDDDEHASPYWLSTMARRMDATGADAISGPVEPLFPAEAPQWAYSTRLYHRSTYPDGALLEYASTANALLRLSSIDALSEPFSKRFRYTGGSDSFLFRSLSAKGARIIWEPSALVYEDVPSSRLSMRWIVSRSYRQGITLARCDRIIFHSRWKDLERATRGAVQFPMGTLEFLLSLKRRDHQWRCALIRMARGAGIFAGLFGATYNEYRRTTTRNHPDHR